MSLLPEIAIIDLDGVVFNSNERLRRHGIHRLEGNIITKVDWSVVSSNREVIRDPLMYPEVLDELRWIAYTLPIRYSTSRGERCREGTQFAMTVNHMPPANAFTLYMRGTGDERSCELLKLHHIQRLRERYRIKFAVDDDWNGKIGKMFQEQGIPHYLSLTHAIVGENIETWDDVP